MEPLALMALSLVAGIVSFTSPCTLPLLPGYASYVSGLATPSDTSEQASTRERRRCLAGALLFVAGFSVVFTVLGATSSALGSLLVAHRGAVTVVSGALIVVMGVLMTGLIRVPLLSRQYRVDVRRIGRGPAGAFPLGAAFAFGWTPCVGPVLASILAAAASTATLTRGVVLLLAYSVGLGMPFVLVAAGLAKGRDRIGWLRRHARRIEIAGGLMLAAMGMAIVTGGWAALTGTVLAYYARLGWPPI